MKVYKENISKQEILKLLYYLLISSPFIILGIIYFPVVPFFAAASLIVGSMIIAVPLSGVFASFVSGLFYPVVRFLRPQPTYSHAERHVNMRKYDEAIKEYSKISSEYPQEIKPYEEMMFISWVYLNDINKAAYIYKNAMQMLKSKQDQESLEKNYYVYLKEYEIKKEL